MKKTIIFITLLILLSSFATAFTPYSNYTYGDKYSEYIPSFVTSRNILPDVGLSWGMNSTDSNFRVLMPYFVTNPFTNEKVADNNTLFAISIAYDETVNALPSCSADFNQTLNDGIWVIDREGNNWRYWFNDSIHWSQDQNVIYYFEADNFDASIDSYSESIDVLMLTETFCPTIKIWGFRKLSWTEVTIANSESRAEDVHTTASTIFDYAINIIVLNYKLWLVAYWVMMILIVIGAISLMIGVPFIFAKHIKRL